MYVYMDVWMCVCMDGWTDGCMDGGGWLYVWMNDQSIKARMDACIYICMFVCKYG